MIAYHRYTLKAKETSMEREGALLCIDGGFADCHPWVELGDLPLQEQLKLLSLSKTTPLTERSLYFARLDREARAEKRSLFDGLAIPPSHHLLLKITEEIPDTAVFKIKMGKELEKEKRELIRLLENVPCRVRIDFNARLNAHEFQGFLEEMDPFLPFFDFIEDPFPFDAKAWRALQEKYGVSLACDAGSERAIGLPHVLILKPAVQSHLPFQHLAQELVVTSYLDHPIGQLSAAYIAAQLNVSLCGLCSHLVYQTNEFSAQLPQKGPYLTPPEGTGFGFDDLLAKIPWKKL